MIVGKPYRTGMGPVLVVVCCLMFLPGFFASGAGASPAVYVDADLQATMESEGVAGYLIAFREKPDLASASAMAWTDRGAFVAERLQAVAWRAQGRVRQYLDSHSVPYKGFWIANVIIVEYSGRAVFEGLAGFPEIASIEGRRSVLLPEPVEETPGDRAIEGVEPNIFYVKAEQVWAMGYTGGGIVVANIDGGVRFSHKALVNQYRGNLGGSFDHNYNWFDPTMQCPDAPCDNANHGTHTMGTIVGDDGAGNRIGMAPGARWIACRACGDRECPDAALLACGQFILAPTDVRGNNPDPSKRPRVVNNSVGRPGGDPWYRQVVDNWQAAGIYPVFANGNAGPRCGSVDTPGDYPNVTAVGNVNHRTGLPWDTSSRGPSVFEKTINPMGYPYLKPQVSAPGVAIRSSIAQGDEAYKEDTGTSMAAPHVTGLIALMLQAAPCLGYAAIERIIMETATPIPFPTGCGDEGPGGVPNNAAGWGMIDALKAVSAVFGKCGRMGVLEGTVTSRGRPLAGATVTTSTRLTATTDGDGRYIFPHIPEGTHGVTVAAFGFYEASSTVSVPPDGPATADYSLRPKGTVRLHGRVVDGSGAGWPLYAAIDVFSPGFTTRIYTDPLSGRYAVSLHRDTPYTLTVSSKGYDMEQKTVEPQRIFDTQDFALRVDKTCGAPGYEDVRALFEEFEGGFPPPGWITTALNGTTNLWRRNDIFKRPNRTGGSGFCADADSEATCYQSKWDAALVSPTVEIPAGTRATLFYKSFFMQFGPGATAWLDASADGGATWRTLTERVWGDAASAEVVDLSAWAGTPALLRWRYASGFCAFYWQIDDVKVVTGCRPREGGLVAGRVFDDNTRQPLAGATVAGDDGTAPTTDGEGVYVLFAPAGFRTLTARGPAGYAPASGEIRVLEGRPVKRDFVLPAGKLSVAPKVVKVTVPSGALRKRVVVLRNLGGIPAAFSIVGAPPWLSSSPESGPVAAGERGLINLSFDARGLSVGAYEGSLQVTGDTPYGSLFIPVAMTVVKGALGP